MALVASFLLPAFSPGAGDPDAGTLSVYDAEADRPSSGLREGYDLCYTIDSKKLWKATSTTVWTDVAGSGGGTPSDTVASETSYGAASAAGSATTYSRGDHTHGTPSLGTSGSTACAGNDSRLSDARTPTAHATSHKSGGSDAVKLDELAAPTDVTTLNATTAAHGLLKKLSNVATEFLDGTGAFSTPSGTGARESLVGMWNEPSTKTNLGTSFVDVYTDANSAGRPVKVDFTSKTQYAASIQWDKIGSGTQNVRAVDADNVANVLFDVAVVSGDNDVALAALPAWATGVKRVKLQCKSTTAADDPVFRGTSIRLK